MDGPCDCVMKLRVPYKVENSLASQSALGFQTTLLHGACYEDCQELVLTLQKYDIC